MNINDSVFITIVVNSVVFIALRQNRKAVKLHQSIVTTTITDVPTSTRAPEAARVEVTAALAKLRGESSMACICRDNENTKISQDDLRYEEFYDCEFEEESDVTYNRNYDGEKAEDNCAENEADIWKVFVDGNEADYNVCEDEDTLLERVWSLSKPPKVPKRTCVVTARRIQVMKERLSSTINGLPTLSETMQEKMMKIPRKRRIVASGVEYIDVRSFNDEKKKESCQGETINIIPACAQMLDKLL